MVYQFHNIEILHALLPPIDIPPMPPILPDAVEEAMADDIVMEGFMLIVLVESMVEDAIEVGRDSDTPGDWFRVIVRWMRLRQMHRGK